MDPQTRREVERLCFDWACQEMSKLQGEVLRLERSYRRMRRNLCILFAAWMLLLAAWLLLFCQNLLSAAGAD